MIQSQDEQKPQQTPQNLQPVCCGCNGRGVVGGFVSMDSGYDAETCPFCDGTGHETNPPSEPF